MALSVLACSCSCRSVVIGILTPCSCLPLPPPFSSAAARLRSALAPSSLLALQQLLCVVPFSRLWHLAGCVVAISCAGLLPLRCSVGMIFGCLCPWSLSSAACRPWSLLTRACRPWSLLTRKSSPTTLLFLLLRHRHYRYLCHPSTFATRPMVDPLCVCRACSPSFALAFECLVLFRARLVNVIVEVC